MLPILPNSAYIRTNKFVTQEWNAMFAPNASTPASTVAGGWRGVLYSNLAIIDPVASYGFFTQPNFDYSWIDGGTSRVWLLAYAASRFSEYTPPYNKCMLIYLQKFLVEVHSALRSRRSSPLHASPDVTCSHRAHP